MSEKVVEESGIIIVFSLIGLFFRILSDALHLPGYYDTVGAFAIASILPYKWAVFTAALSEISIAAIYYHVYLFICWIPTLSILIFGYTKDKIKNIIPAAIITVVVYTILYLTTYMLLTKYTNLSNLLSNRGLFIIILDILLSIIIGYLIGKGYRYITIKYLYKYKPNKRYILFSVILILLILPLYIQAFNNEYIITNKLVELENYDINIMKMDFIWMWFGEKGLCITYYPENRFNKGEIGYQASLGLMWIQQKHDINDISYILKFFSFNRDIWLSIYGCKTPSTKIMMINKTSILFNRFQANKIYIDIYTQSETAPFENITLHGYLIVFNDENKDRMAIVFALTIKEQFKILEPEFNRIINNWRL